MHQQRIALVGLCTYVDTRKVTFASGQHMQLGALVLKLLLLLLEANSNSILPQWPWCTAFVNVLMSAAANLLDVQSEEMD